MKKVNHSILIVSIASAIFIIGVSVALGLRFGVAPGLLTGLGAFTALITCILFANRRLNKKARKKKAETAQAIQKPEESDQSEEES